VTARNRTFAIPGRPERTYPRSGGVEYEGQTVFELSPERDGSADSVPDDPTDDGPTDGDLEGWVAGVLESGPYRYGDFLELPMALYLVRDEDTTDVFRVSVRDGTIRLHVLPETESEGLRRFYERLVERSACRWRVDCRTTLTE
jgi:hypothetical protein